MHILLTSQTLLWFMRSTLNQTFSSFAFPLSSSSLSLILVIRDAFSLESSWIRLLSSDDCIFWFRNSSVTLWSLCSIKPLLRWASLKSCRTLIISPVMRLTAIPVSRLALRSLRFGDVLGSSFILVASGDVLASRVAIRSANLASNVFHQLVL